MPWTTTSSSWPSNCSGMSAKYSEDDIVEEALDPDKPLGRLVAHVLNPDTVRRPSPPYADAVEQWEALEAFLESRLRPE